MAQLVAACRAGVTAMTGQPGYRPAREHTPVTREVSKGAVSNAVVVARIQHAMCVGDAPRQE